MRHRAYKYILQSSVAKGQKSSAKYIIGFGNAYYVTLKGLKEIITCSVKYYSANLVIVIVQRCKCIVSPLFGKYLCSFESVAVLYSRYCLTCTYSASVFIHVIIFFFTKNVKTFSQFLILDTKKAFAQQLFNCFAKAPLYFTFVKNFEPGFE